MDNRILVDGQPVSATNPLPTAGSVSVAIPPGLGVNATLAAGSAVDIAGGAGVDAITSRQDDAQAELENANTQIATTNHILATITNPALATQSQLLGSIADAVGTLPYDAFGRIQVAEPTRVFDSKLIYNLQSTAWDSGGDGSVVHLPAESSAILSLSGVQTSVIRQTFQRFGYQPGKSQLFLMTCVPLFHAGVEKRWGQYDTANGFFFALSETGQLQFKLRSSVSGAPVDTALPFNVDPLNGLGPSGVTFDPAKINIFWFDYEWLGAGGVRWGIYHNYRRYVCGIYNHANVGTTVYFANPNLPLRAEMVRISGSLPATMQQVCSAVISEGNSAPYIIDRAVERENATLSSTLATLGLIGIRPQVGREGAQFRIKSVSVMTTTTTVFKIQAILNPVVANPASPTWTPIAGSNLEACLNANFSLSPISIGPNSLLLATFYEQQTTTSSFNWALPIDARLGSSIAGVRDELWIGIRGVSAVTGENFNGAVVFQEWM